MQQLIILPSNIIYDFQTAIAHVSTAKKLAEASQKLRQKGYRIKSGMLIDQLQHKKNYSTFILTQS